MERLRAVIIDVTTRTEVTAEVIEWVIEALRREHIYVRHFTKERINNYLRISIGTPAENARVVDVLAREDIAA